MTAYRPCDGPSWGALHQMMLDHWRREHRLAFGAAIALGAFVGTIIMVQQVQVCLRPHLGSTYLYFLGIGWSSFLPACWFTIVFWPLAGAAIGATVIWIWRLMSLKNSN